MEFRSSVYPVHCSAPLLSVPQAEGKQDIQLNALPPPPMGIFSPLASCSRCLAQTLGFPSLQLAAGTFLNSYPLQPSVENCPQVTGASLPQMPGSYIVLSPLPAPDQPWKPGANAKQAEGQRVQKPPSLVSRQDRLCSALSIQGSHGIRPHPYLASPLLHPVSFTLSQLLRRAFPC